MSAGWLAESTRPLARGYDTALLDLDGVVYVGSAAVPGATEALMAARAQGMRLAFVTNNASRPPSVVAAHLRDLGVPATDGQVITSAQASARLLAGRLPPGSRVLVVGGAGLVEALRERDLVPVFSADDQPAAVVQGFAPQVDWGQLAEAAVAVARGLPWVAANLDPTVPTPRGLAPGNGTLVDAVATATGRRPLVAGKPEVPLHREALLRSGGTHPLVVGDRLDTDIEGANRADTDSMLVLTGVTGVGELLAAPAALRPRYLARDLTGLLMTHPRPERIDGGWRCGGWTCVAHAGGLRLTGTGDPLDALRAVAEASWHTPHRVALEPVTETLTELLGVGVGRPSPAPTAG